MQLAIIKGYVTSTIKHPSLSGWRMLIAQPCGTDGNPEGAPQVVLDHLGAAIHQRVILTSDGIEARKLVRDDLSPARWTVMGIVDPERSLATS
ncbi:MAG: EutN/CcmL family microcompartment protein [Candidatus Methylacidiphilales bacterium]